MKETMKEQEGNKSRTEREAEEESVDQIGTGQRHIQQLHAPVFKWRARDLLDSK